MDVKMTVKEYLQILNGVPVDSELSSEAIKMHGLLDLTPPKVANSISWSEVEMQVDGENIVSNRTFHTETDDYVPMKKVTPLNDDISLHCPYSENGEEIIQGTIKCLEAEQLLAIEAARITDGEPVDYQPRIEKFQEALAKSISHKM